MDRQQQQQQPNMGATSPRQEHRSPTMPQHAGLLQPNLKGGLHFVSPTPSNSSLTCRFFFWWVLTIISPR